MHGRMRMGSKFEILRFFKSGYAHDRNISFFRRRASRATGNTLIKPNCASVRQSRDSLHRDRHKVTKKSRRRRALKPLELRSSVNSRRRVFLAHYYACNTISRSSVSRSIKQLAPRHDGIFPHICTFNRKTLIVSA